MKAKIKVKNGYWTYNDKPLVNCTFPERQIVFQFIRSSVFSMELEEQKEEIIVPKKKKPFFLLEPIYDLDFVKLIK